MEKLGFSKKWVKLMMNCVKSATYRFKINGKLSIKIYPQRGLRQGDPLSPYLFILAAESFTVLMEKALRDNLISGIRCARRGDLSTNLDHKQIYEAELITRIPISLINKKDHFVWPYRNDGQYLVRTGYHAAKEEKDTKEETKLNKASTSQNLREHKSAITPRCSICQEEDETIEHVLLLCPWTRAVWFGSSLQIVPTAYNVRYFEKWMMNTIEKIKNETGKEHDKILCNLGCVCWCIWKTRNQHIFQQTKVNPENVIIYSEHLAVEYHNATKGLNIENKPKVGRNGESKRITWRLPPHNKVKVNTDAAFHRETGMAALAVVVRDSQEKIITRTTSTFKTTSALAAEAQAYREALILIKDLQIANCIIETNCLPLVQAIKARTPLAEVDVIIRDILQLLDEAPDVGATWTPREDNKLAHQLAVMAMNNQL
ncbi:uncharacterized protein [Arachis hypogaea]|uniref:uncharacterized protein n=1 Tax=Arachis hypogaea TaxID=3818 RepID=UPI000DECF8FA